MKNNRSRRMRYTSRALALILALAMCLTMSPALVFADHTTSTEETKNLLVFGASTSMGYALPDFYNSNAGFAVANNDLTTWKYEDAKAEDDRGRISEMSYPWQLKQHIQDTENVKVDLSSMCLNGMRTDELHALLDPEYYQAVYDWEKKTTVPSNSDGSPTSDIGFLTNHIRSFVAHLGRGGAKLEGVEGFEDGPVTTDRNRSADGLPDGEGYKRASAYTKKEIENADVIVVDVCMNNFGTYMAERIGGKHGINGYAEKYYMQKPEDIIGASPKVIETAMKLKKTLKSSVSMLNNDSADEFLDAFIYCFIDCITNYTADIELIREINPDAKIIAVGVYNTLDGITLSVGGTEIDFGAICAKGFEVVNTYIKTLDPNSNYYSYADLSGGIETFMNQIVFSESFDSLMADEYGKALMENMYSADPAVTGSSFKQSFLPDSYTNMFSDEAKPNYMLLTGMVAQQFASQGFGISFPAWEDYLDEEGNIIRNNTKIAGTSYVAAGDFTSSNLAEMISLVNDSSEPTIITKGMFETYDLNGLPMYKALAYSFAYPQVYEALYNGAKDQGLNDSLAKAYAEDNADDKTLEQIEKVTPEYVYTQVQDQFASLSGGMLALTDYSEYTDADSPITAKTYLIYDNSLPNYFGVKADADDEDTIYLTPELIPSKEKVQRMLYAAAKNTSLNLDRLMLNLGYMNANFGTGEHVNDIDLGNGSYKTVDGVTNFKAVMMDLLLGDYADKEASDYLATLEVIQVVDRFLLYMGVGQHPSKLGTEAMAVDVLKAYDSNMSAFEETMAEIEAKMAAVIEMLKKTGAKDDIEKIEARLAQIQDLMAVIDESGLTPDDLRKFMAMKDQFQAALEQTMDKMGITYDDLIAQGKFIFDAATTDEAIANLKKMNELIQQYPALKAKYEALAQKLLDELGITTDDLIAQGKFIVDAATSEEAIKTLKQLNALIQNYPALKAKYMGIAQNMLDALGITVDDLIAQGKFIADAATSEEAIKALKDLNWLIQNYPALKAKYMGIAQSVLNELGTTVEELIAQGKVIYDQVPTEEILGAVKMMTELVKSLPELKAEYQGYVDEIFDALGITLDDVINAAKNIKDSTDIKDVAETIKLIRSYAAQIPAYTEQAKAAAAMVQEKIDLVNGMLEEMGLSMTGESLDELKAIAEKLANAKTKEDFEAIVNDLLPIGMKLLDIGAAVANLPEYQLAMDEFMEASEAAQAGLGTRVEALERQVAHLTAKSIEANITSKASFTSKAAKLTIKWVGDEDAAGYYLKIDGKNAGTIAGGKGDKTYEIPKAKYGKAYKVEVTPFVDYVPEEGAPEVVEGRTFTKSVTAKLAAPKNKTPKKGKKSLKVKWNKVAGADGYQISLKAKGKKTKKVTVKGGSKASKKVKKLAAKKKYTVKVRAYKTIGGKKCYSAWSKAKKAKTK